MQCSAERRQVAARIGILTRHRGPADPEVLALRRRLDELRIAEIAAWAAGAAAAPPDPAEVAHASTETRRLRRYIAVPAGDGKARRPTAAPR